MTPWRFGLVASGLIHGTAIAALIATGAFDPPPSEPAIIVVELAFDDPSSAAAALPLRRVEARAPDDAPNAAGAAPLDSTKADIELPVPVRAAQPQRPSQGAPAIVTKIAKPDRAKPPSSPGPNVPAIESANRSDVAPDAAPDAPSDHEEDGAAMALGALALVGLASPAETGFAKAGAADPAKGLGGSGSSAAMVLVDSPKPDYPWRARREGLEGRVVVRVEVPAAGDPKVGIVESSGAALLDRAALAALAQWRFAPAMVEGVAVAGTIDVPIVFRLVD